MQPPVSPGSAADPHPPSRRRPPGRSLGLVLVLVAGCFGGEGGVEGGGPDADGDGLSDAEEAALGTDPQSPDSDGDGQSDGVEVKRRMNPLKKDSDGDGAFDGEEVGKLGTDPLDPDSDGDGVMDGAEVRVLGTDPTVADEHPPEMRPDGTIPGPEDEETDPPEEDVPQPRYAPDAPLPETMRCDGPTQRNTCFVRLPGLTFWMGAQGDDPQARNHDEHARPDESPVHQVTVGPIWIQKQEATAAMYARCVDDGFCDEAGVNTTPGLSTYADYRSKGTGSMVLNTVTWAGAQRLCAWLGGRLPTEAEWERAARGADARPFPWGDVPRCGVHQSTGFLKDVPDPDAAQLSCDNEGVAEPGDLRGQSAEGLRGLAGNVWEWTADWYGPYPEGPVTDPTGPAQGTVRVQRGGGWSSTSSWELRSAARGSMDPTLKLPDVGLRCVRPVLEGEGVPAPTPEETP